MFSNLLVKLMEKNDKNISIKKNKTEHNKRDFKRNSESNNDRNLKHNSHKLRAHLTLVSSEWEQLWLSPSYM